MPHKKGKLKHNEDCGLGARLLGLYTRTSGQVAKVKPYLDFGELMKVELNNDKMQPFDDRWDEVLSGMTERLGENILGRQDRLSKKPY